MPAVRPAMVNRETDFVLPKKLWSTWIPENGSRAIIRALSASEEAALENRAAELRAGLVAMQREQRDDARAALHGMLGGFRSLRQAGEDAETAVEVLLAVLREFPAWAIEDACLRIAQRRADCDPPLDPRWAPSDGQIYEIVDRIVKHYRTTLTATQALLAAPVEVPQEPRPSRAEIEAKLGRKIGDPPAAPEIDGKHAMRVAAELAERKARRDAESTGPPASAA